MREEIVIARYAEDVAWAEGRSALIYNKGSAVQTKAKQFFLPNLGREAHTYLHHIISTWDDLADTTLFTQGGLDHLPPGVRLEQFFDPVADLVVPRLVCCREWGADGRIAHFGIWKEKLNRGQMLAGRLSLVAWFRTYLRCGSRSPWEHSLCSRSDLCSQEASHSATAPGVLQGLVRNGCSSHRPGGRPLPGACLALCVWIARSQSSVFERLTMTIDQIIRRPCLPVGLLPRQLGASMFELMPVYRSANLEPREVFQLYLDRNYDKLTESFFRYVFDYLNENHIPGTRRLHAPSIIQFVQVFLTLFTQPDYVIPERFIYRFLDQNELISNIVAMTPFQNTDGFLELVRYGPSNLVKILTLYSARNRIRFDRRAFFDAHPQLASLWYCKFCSLYKTALVSKDACQHMEEHLSYHDERMTLTTDIAEPYFGSTYVDGVIDRHVKPFLNNVVRRSARFTAENKPNPKKIAVISDLWCPTHSVYRNYLAFVKEMAKDFHLTFFHVFKGREELDVSDFHEVHRLDFRDGSLDIGPLASNDFVAVYFPDVGMTLSSIMLANYRLAPIQFCSPGHSVSTWGSEIDYFVSGADVEVAEAPEKRYSERLVLLPGMGVIHNQPLYTLAGRKKGVPEVVMNFPTSGQKLNYKFLQTLRKLLDQVRRPLRFRFFPAVLNQKNGYLPFLTEVQQVLGRSSAILDVKPFFGIPGVHGFYGGRRPHAGQLPFRRVQHRGGQLVRAAADGGLGGGQMVQPDRRGHDAPCRYGGAGLQQRGGVSRKDPSADSRRCLARGLDGPVARHRHQQQDFRHCRRAFVSARG